MTMGTVLADVTTVFTSAIGWAGTVASTIIGEPLLLIFCILPLVGLGVGLFRRLLHIA